MPYEGWDRECTACGEAITEQDDAAGWYRAVAYGWRGNVNARAWYCPEHAICTVCGDLQHAQHVVIGYGYSAVYVHENCAYWCEYCDVHDVYEHAHYYCDDCETYGDPDDHEHDTGVHDYSYKPYPRFWTERGESDHDPGTLYIGIEQEVVAKRSVADVVALFEGHDLFYLKHDSSLPREGVEIVSHPMTLGGFREHHGIGNRLMAVARATSDCGVHLHLSRDAFSTYHLYKFLRFHYEYPDYVQQIAGRVSEHYATFRVDKDRRTLRDKARERNGARYDNRYVAVNLCNRDTIELRYFRSTVRPLRLAAYVQWAHALYMFTRDAKDYCKAHPDRMINPITFERWVRDHVKDYPDLPALLRGDLDYGVTITNSTYTGEGQ